jgi:type II secretory pathway component PulF
MNETVTAVLVCAPPLVFLLGVVTLMLVRLATGPAPGDHKPVYLIVIRVFAWILTGVSVLVGAVLFLPGLGIIWFATLAVVISMYYSTQVATQRYAMLALVGAAAERSIPLETAFAAFGRERGGWMRRRTSEIVFLLTHGAPLPTALKEVPGALPPEAMPLVCVGYESGELGPAAAQAIATRNLFEPVWQALIPKIGYVCFLPAFAVGVLAFISLVIMPQFQKIFVDFGIRLPDITVGLIDACAWSAHFWPLWGVVWLCLTLLFAYGLLRYAGSIRWDLPGMGWLMRRRHIATVLDALALAARRQRPLGDVLSTLATSYPQSSIERRLLDAYDDLQAGGDDLQCLFHRGLLGKTDLALLQAARRNGNLAWAAREMADSNRRRFIYRVNALTQVLFPAVIVFYGLLMTMIAVAMFLPMASLIRRF